MTNVKYLAFWVIMFLAVIFWLRSLDAPGPEKLPPGQIDMGNEIFIFEEEPTVTAEELQEDPLF